MGARAQLDLGIYIDIVNDVKFAWKVQRDVEERGWTEDQVREDIEKRLPDFSQYVAERHWPPADRYRHEGQGDLREAYRREGLRLRLPAVRPFHFRAQRNAAVLDSRLGRE